MTPAKKTKAPPLTLAVFKARNRHPGSADCTLVLALRRLSETDRKQTLAAIADREIQGAAIAAVLHERGIQVSPNTIQRHRRQGCSRCTVGSHNRVNA